MNRCLTHAFGLSTFLHATIVALLIWTFVNAPAELALPRVAPFVLVRDGHSAGPAGDSDAVPSLGVRLPAPPPRPLVGSESTAARAGKGSYVSKPLVRALSSDSQRISIDEFRQKHPIAPPITGRLNSTGVPKVSETFSPAARSLDRSSAEAGDLSFVPALLADLRNAFVGTGFDAGLSVHVEFQLSHDGFLTGMRILRSSGLPEFDAAALLAFRKLRVAGFDSSQLGVRYSVTFRASGE